MNKLGKIFVSVSIILAIALIIMTTFYINAAKSSKDNLMKVLDNAELLVKTNLAIEDAGYRIQPQEDGSFKLVEGASE